jgi:hypothetical protein
MADQSPAVPEFHDVVFTVEKVLRGAAIYDEHQIITAREIIKLNKEDVEELNAILREYLDGYLDGAGPLLLTFVGKFSR